MPERIHAKNIVRSEPESVASAGAREHYERILESIGEGVHSLDSEGRITFANAPAASMLGWSREELVGKRQHSLLHHTRADGKPYLESECPIVAALREGRAHRQDGDIFWKKDGTSLPVDYVVTPIREEGAVVGAVVVFRDATERRQAAGRLAHEQAARSEGERLSQELQRVLMQVPAAVCTTRGPDHIIETANPLYQQLVGRRDLVGKSKREVFAASRDELSDLLDRVYATGESMRATKSVASGTAVTAPSKRDSSILCISPCVMPTAPFTGSCVTSSTSPSLCARGGSSRTMLRS
jgi:PAS domain S-box-containing protein